FLIITLSISALKKYGEPKKNKSWGESTVMVERGVYGVIRHPFSLGWIILTFSLAMITQNWLSTLCMSVQIPLILVDVIYDEHISLNKFGIDYTSYKDSVTMFNIPSGLIRYYKRRDSKMNFD
ncbi:MAG: methyltransferase family protein, partial [Candidatus Thorarchaeota archaeon]